MLPSQDADRDCSGGVLCVGAVSDVGERGKKQMMLTVQAEQRFRRRLPIGFSGPLSAVEDADTCRGDRTGVSHLD